jgi:hypothetical protein
MAFVDEVMPENDKVRIASIITREKIRERVSYVHGLLLHTTNTWTGDAERDSYLICLVGKGREEEPACYTLGVGDEFVIFVLEESSVVSANGAEINIEVSRMNIPKKLDSLREQIKI